jgi:hypothetical protein
MNDENLKNSWNNFNEDDMEFVSIKDISSGTYFRNKSTGIQQKIRTDIVRSIAFKCISFIAFVILLSLNDGTREINIIGYLGIGISSALIFLEYRIFRSFEEETNMAVSPRENLSGMLRFIRRKSDVLAFLTCTGQLLIFVPGVMVYYLLTYGYIKPLTPMSFFVFGVLILIGTVMMYLRMTSQLKYHGKQIAICLSDMNDENLLRLSTTIEKERKQDQLVKGLSALVLIFGFVLMIALFKTAMN